jgi:hypothetical protein
MQETLAKCSSVQKSKIQISEPEDELTIVFVSNKERILPARSWAVER